MHSVILSIPLTLEGSAYIYIYSITWIKEAILIKVGEN